LCRYCTQQYAYCINSISNLVHRKTVGNQCIAYRNIA
jgi:hypothetical protein